MGMMAKCLDKVYVPVERIEEYQICKNDKNDKYFIIYYTDSDKERQSYDEFDTYLEAEDHIRFLIRE